MTRIYHRNIRRIHDYVLDKNNERILILSELCGGGSLYSLINELQMVSIGTHSDFIESIFFQLTQAVQHMYYYLDGPVKRRPLIIDPKCVYFTDYGVLKVDLIRVLIYGQEPEVRRLLFKMHCTDPDLSSRLNWYMAPETQNARFFTEKTSIYSIGSVIYEMLTLSVPKSIDLRLLPSNVISIANIHTITSPLIAKWLHLARCKNQRERASAAQLIDQMLDAGVIENMELYQGVTRVDKNYTTLMEAARENNYMAARMNIGQAGLINNEGLTALMIAAIHNHPQVAKILLKREAFFTTRSFTVRDWRFADATALMLGAAHGSTDVCRLLLSVEGGIQTEKGWTALMYAAGCKQVATTLLLVDKEARLCTNQLSSFGSGFTALMIAAYNDSIDTCLPLIKKEANMFTAPTNKNYPGWSALVFAAAICSLRCTQILLKYEGTQFASLALQSVGKLKNKVVKRAQETRILQEILQYIKQPDDYSQKILPSISLMPRLSISTSISPSTECKKETEIKRKPKVSLLNMNLYRRS